MNQAVQNLSYAEDEIDLRALFSTLWQGKWLIIAVTSLCALAGVAYALFKPNLYTASAIVAPTQDGGGMQLSGQLSGKHATAFITGIRVCLIADYRVDYRGLAAIDIDPGPCGSRRIPPDSAIFNGQLGTGAYLDAMGPLERVGSLVIYGKAVQHTTLIGAQLGSDNRVFVIPGRRVRVMGSGRGTDNVS